MSRSAFPIHLKLHWYDVLLAYNRLLHGKPAYEGLGIQIQAQCCDGGGGGKAERTDKHLMHMEGKTSTLVKDECTYCFSTAKSM